MKYTNLIEEVRKTREKILQDANGDISKVLAEIKEMQIKDKDKLVSFGTNVIIKVILNNSV